MSVGNTSYLESPRELWKYSWSHLCKSATMYKVKQHLEDKSQKDTIWNDVRSSNKPFSGWMCLFLFMIFEIPELCLSASVAGSKAEHEGLCPNKLNNNLWVDAQSTCERECNVDEVMSFIKSLLVPGNEEIMLR